MLSVGREATLRLVPDIFLNSDSLITASSQRSMPFIALADNRKEAINKAWEHGGPDFRARFDKSTAQGQEMKEGALRVL